MASAALARLVVALTLVATGAAAVSGCATKPQTRYAWGNYEEQIYVVHAKPGTLTPEAQVQQLEHDREAARAANKPLPPGWHANLGYLYFQVGRSDLAREELLAEKTAFPEATTFVDHLLANLAQVPEKPR